MRNYAPAAGKFGMRNAECGITRLRRENSECGMRNAELRACGGTDAAGLFDAERERVLTGACACGRRGLRPSCNFGGENCKYSLQNARENCKEQI